METRELTVTEDRNIDLAPRMVMTTQQALARLAEFQAFVSQVMVDGTDYGKIPGVDKPTLLKPGAEKLCEIYGLTPNIDVTNRVEDWDNGFFHYECACRLVSRRNGLVYAVGVGSCNSREKRYADRWVFGSEIPVGVDKESLQKREFNGRNGKFVKYLWKNEDIYTLVNTILKMAKKRALIDATLSATRSSGMFTQDVEDWIDPDAIEHAPASKPTSSAPRQAPTVQTQSADVWPDIPDFENTGKFSEWCNKHFKLTPTAIWREVSTLTNGVVKSGNDVAGPQDLAKLAELIRGAFGKKPEEVQA